MGVGYERVFHTRWNRHSRRKLFIRPRLRYVHRYLQWRKLRLWARQILKIAMPSPLCRGGTARRRIRFSVLDCGGFPPLFSHCSAINHSVSRFDRIMFGRMILKTPSLRCRCGIARRRNEFFPRRRRRRLARFSNPCPRPSRPKRARRS